MKGFKLTDRMQASAAALMLLLVITGCPWDSAPCTKKVTGNTGQLVTYTDAGNKEHTVLIGDDGYALVPCSAGTVTVSN